MFFDAIIMNSKTIGTAWRAANDQNVPKESDDASLPDICRELDGWVASENPAPRERMSLRTSSVLVDGVTRVYKQRAEQLMKDSFKLDTDIITRKRRLSNNEEADDIESEMQIVSPAKRRRTRQSSSHMHNTLESDYAPSSCNEDNSSSSHSNTHNLYPKKPDRFSPTFTDGLLDVTAAGQQPKHRLVDYSISSDSSREKLVNYSSSSDVVLTENGSTLPRSSQSQDRISTKSIESRCSDISPQSSPESDRISTNLSKPDRTSIRSSQSRETERISEYESPEKSTDKTNGSIQFSQKTIVRSLESLETGIYPKSIEEVTDRGNVNEEVEDQNTRKSRNESQAVSPVSSIILGNSSTRLKENDVRVKESDKDELKEGNAVRSSEKSICESQTVSPVQSLVLGSSSIRQQKSDARTKEQRKTVSIMTSEIKDQSTQTLFPPHHRTRAAIDEDLPFGCLFVYNNPNSRIPSKIVFASLNSTARNLVCQEHLE